MSNLRRISQLEISQQFSGNELVGTSVLPFVERCPFHMAFTSHNVIIMIKKVKGGPQFSERRDIDDYLAALSDTALSAVDF
mmetsp:Transcript_10871/g.25746  ORF Transcript_10871/g.25746 Transcript_10871/m.25746 type:complete len:81 (+) Transcript_10871:610-852(+)